MSQLQTYLRKNDSVMVVVGKEKGKTGRILKFYPKTSRVLIEKLNLVKRHQKPTQKNPQGGMIEKESGIHISNVMLVCPKCIKPVRISHKIVNDKKIRACKKCDTAIQVGSK